ncbi:MAG: hypothetical protein PWP23_2912 [Candidatus Sumerlaeota bacterium]|nr:hypothetical protein [Candidatus Sumerlaeota bacterium]
MLPLSLRESFDGENPWVRRLVGWPPWRASWRTRLAYGAMGAGLAAFATGGAAAFLSRDAGWTTAMGSLSYALLIAWAFIAPSLGAQARRKLDYDVCLPESLATPLPARAYLAPVHGRIVVQTLFGGVLHAVAASFILLLLVFPDARMGNAIAVESLMRMVLRMMSFGRIESTASPLDLWLCGGVALLATANYMAGIYLHGSMLARICQRSPLANVQGGLLTAAQIVLMMLLLGTRFITARYFLQGLFQWPQTTTELLVYFLTVEALFAGVRFAWARWTWQRILEQALDETSAAVVGK